MLAGAVAVLSDAVFFEEAHPKLRLKAISTIRIFFIRFIYLKLN
jgi:hypothetical protein